MHAHGETLPTQDLLDVPSSLEAHGILLVSYLPSSLHSPTPILPKLAPQSIALQENHFLLPGLRSLAHSVLWLFFLEPPPLGGRLC